ncbi:MULTISPECIES: CaiB/BaiF CoA transferase family protein [unclassified Cobetia]|uniref:CaiB/BaiF CoA transferase family protein n=1 Tax=unclassified Cobetia TaxID=2609414 RepID=UPI00178CA74B|nr:MULTISPECIES: CaiB/BaiF CoA-transferase family protein [unclassified Cobetia]MBE2169928.1 CoA transferase [Cobetia sp. 2AS1]MDH2446930.1 CaiB/BaiF CoA-transferase family protein [Cobetia sp. 2AS]
MAISTQTELKKGPLDGITVLDFSRVLAGPYCTMVLADLGARVIKVEKIGTGDDTREFGPFVEGESAYFSCFNRNKESIVLDIKSPRDRELLERLLDEADVLVENFRPGVMDRLGYGPERLARTHPHLIYSSISGFGHTGPFSELPGYDMVVQAMGGIMSLTGWPDGEPARVGTSFGDLSAALFAAVGILASLYSRTRDAQGTRVDIGMLDCQAALMETALARFDIEGKVPHRTGDCHPSLAPFESFNAQDGKLVIAAGNDTLFLLMADAIGAARLAFDPRFLSNDMRCRNRPELVIEMEMILVQQPVQHWVDLLNEEGVPCSPINTIDKLFDHPQLKARNMIVQVQGKAGKPFRTAGNPIKLTGRRDIDSQVPCSAPGLGQHREAILDELMARHGAYHLPESDRQKHGGQPVENGSEQSGDQSSENGSAEKARPARKSSSSDAKTRGAVPDAASSSDASSPSTATSCDTQ